MMDLEHCKLFKELPTAQLEILRRVTRSAEYAPGELIFREGAPPDGLYVVRSGRVKIMASFDMGHGRVVAEVLPGDFFGEIGVLDELPRSASATADVASSVYFIPAAELWEMLRSSPDLLLMVVRGITQRFREFNRQFLQMVLQAERMSVVGRFASSIVHDLKNPLMIINLAIESVCREEATQPERALGRERIQAQVERLTSLVNDILDYSRGSQTSQIFERRSYAAFIKPLVAELQEELRLRSIELRLENQPPEGRVALNPKRLSRVFYNLVGNAADAMSNGGVVLFRFQVTDQQVVTEIEDAGPGIDPKNLERIFEAFFTLGKPHGTGLGLAICQRIVQEHQGTLTARNRPGGGAVFTLTLPRKE